MSHSAVSSFLTIRPAPSTVDASSVQPTQSGIAPFSLFLLFPRHIHVELSRCYDIRLEAARREGDVFTRVGPRPSYVLRPVAQGQDPAESS